MQRKQKSEKGFDAVATMRRIRAALSQELEGKSFEEVRLLTCQKTMSSLRVLAPPLGRGGDYQSGSRVLSPMG